MINSSHDHQAKANASSSCSTPPQKLCKCICRRRSVVIFHVTAPRDTLVFTPSRCSRAPNIVVLVHRRGPSRRHPVFLVHSHVNGVFPLVLRHLARRGFTMRRGRGGGRGAGRGGGGGSGASSGGTAVPLLAAMASQRVVVLTADGRCVKVRRLLFSALFLLSVHLVWFSVFRSGFVCYSGLELARP